MNQIMKTQLGRISGKFGILGIIVILFSTGCASQNVTPVSRQDLNTFVIDCSKRDEQLRYLASLASSPGEQGDARLANLVQPYKILTDPDTFVQRYNVGNGQINYDIRQLIWLIQRNCG